MKGPLRLSDDLLPLYIVPFRLKETLHPGGRAKAAFELSSPEYPTREYCPSAEWIKRMRADRATADRILEDWSKHLTDYTYAAQFVDDPNGARYRSLCQHTELVSLFADTVLRIDTSLLWSAVRNAKYFEFIHSDFRAERDKTSMRGEYEARLQKCMRDSVAGPGEVIPLIQRLRRAAASQPSSDAFTSANVSPQITHEKKRFLIALSFPGERRAYVEEVAKKLGATLGSERILYDEFHKAEFARPNLDVYLPRLYHTETELNVVFLCSEYSKKEWCGLEWRAIRDLMKQREDDRIMLMRFDNAHIDGLYSIDGYIDLARIAPGACASLILQRSRAIHGEPAEAVQIGVANEANLKVFVNSAWIAFEAEIDRASCRRGLKRATKYPGRAKRLKEMKLLSREQEAMLDALRKRYREWRDSDYRGMTTDDLQEFIEKIGHLRAVVAAAIP